MRRTRRQISAIKVGLEDNVLAAHGINVEEADSLPNTILTMFGQAQTDFGGQVNTSRAS